MCLQRRAFHRIFVPLLFLLPLLSLLSVARGQVIITEFMASNSRTLTDEDNAYSDWIEIHNETASTVNLNNWSLTDDPNNLIKWRFPATNLFANGYLVVFASGKDRAIAGSPLHTSFSLSAAGEYLALVRPDGSVASEFAPQFPQQFQDISYGIGQEIQVTRLISNSSPVRVVVATNGPAPSAWTNIVFDDSSWIPGTNGVGYESTIPGFAVRNFKANIAINSLTDAENVIATPSLRSSLFSENRNVINYFNTGGQGHYGNDITFPGLTINSDVDDFALEATATVTIPTVGNWTFGVNSDDGFGLTIGTFSMSYPSPRGPGDSLATFNFPSAGDYPLRLVFYEHGGGSEVELFAAPGSFAGWGANFQLVGDMANAGLTVKSSPSFGNPTNSFRSVIRTDLVAAMTNKASSAYIRIPFSVADPSVLNSLTLQMKYDDGFVAYLNGVEIARRNVPANVQWNSVTPASRSNTLALAYEDINVSPYLSLLQPGANVLAIQGVNDATNSTDFLIVAELAEFKAVGLTNHYFTTPSPGGPNTSNYFAFVEDTKFSQDRGFYDTNFSLVITSATPGVTIRYTTNCSAPSETNGFVYSGPIPIAGTTIVRARGYRDGFEPTDIDTQTYIYLDQVIHQTGAGFPGTWGSATADYEMDPNVVNDPAYSGTIKNDLKSIPVISLVLDVDDLFGAAGIYSNPTQSGAAWERPGSMEFFDANSNDHIQANCAIRAQGGASRDPNNAPKHGFRLLFKEGFGPTKLKFPLFKDSNIAEYDTFDLHARFNDSWVWVSQPSAQYIRDLWCRDTQRDMGHVSPHGRFVHLYVNGLYWGLYDPGEKPDASFAANYFGGEKEEYDAWNSDELIDGDANAWNAMFAIANAGITNDAAYGALQQYLDVPSFIDYMLVNLYAGNTDWPWHNWTAARRRLPGAGFEFMSWDAEWTLADVNGDVTGVNTGAPGILYNALRAHPEFRQLFADRVQKQFFNGGALTPEAVDARWMKRATEIDRAIVGESARWGDYRQEPPFTRNLQWISEQNRLRTQYFPQRSAIVVNQLRNGGLFPSLSAPIFRQLGGSVPPGFQLYITNSNPTGSILYTLDGSDPRLPGGTIAPSAITYSGPLTINVHTVVRARVKDGATWSALTEATFYEIQDFSKLKITEIMYNPSGTTNLDGDNFEFLEFKNSGTATLDLSGVSFSAGITFGFTNNTLLAPGQFFVLARNLAAFQTRYPAKTPDGVYTGKLDNGGEAIALSHILGGTILQLTYSDSLPWPVTADGPGFSLVPTDPLSSLSPNDPRYWRASSFPGGSPGADDPVSSIAPVLINEVLTHSDQPAGDMVELWNPTSAPVDIGGWFLTDDAGFPQKFRIPDGTALSGFGFQVFSEADFDATPGASNSFALSSLGEQVLLFSGDANTNLTGYAHGLSFGAAATNVSFGRYVTSTGEEQFPPQSAQTFGGTNSGPLVGPVVINEIMYHPEAGYDEFVELKNISSNAVPLFDPAQPTNTWKLSGLGYQFPTNVSIPAGGYLLITPIDPQLFRAKYSVAAEAQIVGPYSGNLQDSGERLELKRPAAATLDAQGQIVVPYITVDEVRYNDKAPWPTSADGEGPSLQRLDSTAYGNDPINWFASGITPGGANVFNSAPLVSIVTPTNASHFIVPANVNILISANDSDGAISQVEVLANGIRLALLTNSPYALTWTNPGPGSYTLTAKAKDNGFATTVSSPVVITVDPPPVGNGTGLNGDYYDNIDFTGTKLTRVDPTVNFNWGGGSPDPSMGPDQFSVRWTGLVQPRYSGSYAFYTTSDDGVRLWVDNQQIINNWTDHGTLDDVGFITLQAGRVYDIRMEYYENGGGAVAALGWAPPGYGREIIPTSQLYPTTNAIFRITSQPRSTNVIQGSTATFSVTATGLNPRTYQWYFNDTNVLAGATSPSLTLNNVQPAAQGSYRVIVNDGTTTLTSDPAFLAVVSPPVLVSPLSPARFSALEGSSFTLSITADGTLPISYSWRSNFIVITNMIVYSNTCNFTVSNLHGITNIYTVRLTNIAGANPILGTNAIVTVLTPPIITNQPASLNLGVGSNATFRVGVRGTTPLSYQWFKNGAAIPSGINSSLNLNNIQPADEGAYYVVISNVVSVVTSTNAVLFIDSDKDGLPDSWELAHGLNPTNKNDATLDADGDSMSNLQEYIAGTDPQDPQSYLRIDAAPGPNSGAILSFTAISNRTYSIVYNTNLTNGTWTRLMDVAIAAGTNRPITFTNAPNAEPGRTYRLVVPKLP